MDADQIAADVYDFTLEDWPGEIELYRRFAGPAASLLEVACGTGRVTRQLARPGLEITGFDKSPHMLEIARRKCALFPSIQLVEADMRGFVLRKRFDLAIIPGHSFQFMLSIEDQLACLRCIKEHLVPNGALVVHVNHDDLAWLAGVSADAEPPENAPRVIHLPDGRVIQITKRWSYDRSTQTASATTIYEEIGAQGTVLASQLRGPVPLHCYFPYELDHLFQRAGFEVTVRYGDFSPALFENRSPEMIWVGRASGG